VRFGTTRFPLASHEYRKARAIVVVFEADVNRHLQFLAPVTAGAWPTGARDSPGTFAFSLEPVENF
jgi:hypothetical protein